MTAKDPQVTDALLVLARQSRLLWSTYHHQATGNGPADQQAHADQ
jgi:hypothetical protein